MDKIFKIWGKFDFLRSILLITNAIVPTVMRPKDIENKLPTNGWAHELFSVITDKSGIIYIPYVLPNMSSKRLSVVYVARIIPIIDVEISYSKCSCLPIKTAIELEVIFELISDS